MPNWKKIIVSGSDASLNSLVVTSGVTITGSLNVSGSTTQVGNNTLLGNTLLTGSITISGSFGPGSPGSSVRIYGNTRHDGYITFNPVSTNIDTSISASYIYVSGSTNDLYFSQNGSGYNNVTRLRWLEGNLYTGLLNGGILSTASSTVYQVGSGSGIIVDLNASLNDNPYPTIKYLNWPNLTASIAPLTGSYQQAFVAIDDNATIYAQGLPFSNGQFDTLINIGNVLFQNQSTINGVKTQPSVAYGFEQAQNTFNRAFGPLKLSGYTLAPSGSSTGSLIVGSGTAYAPGSNYIVNPNEPYYASDSGTNTSKIFRYYQSGSTWVYLSNAGAGYTVIDPTKYSNNGTLTAVPGGAGADWSIQRVFWFPNSVAKAIVVYYGNAIYDTEAEARANIDFESFTEAPNTAANAIYLGAIIVRSNFSNWTQTDRFTIYPGGLFRQVGGSGGGGSIVTQTLAGLSDVSLTTPTDYQALVYDFSIAKWINASNISASITGNAATATSSSYATSALSSSFATTAISASFATSASFAISSSRAVTSSFAITASYVTGSIYTSTNPALSASFATTSISASFATSASFAITASFATSALSSSFATSAISSSFATTALSSSFASTASYVANDIITASISSNTITFTKGNGTTFPITVATGSGTVSSVSTSGNVNGITLTGGPITTTGTITLGGTLSNVQSSQLATSSLMIGSTNIALGATASSLTGLTSVTSTAFTGSLFGTSSWATNATTATTATNATNVAVTDTTTGTGPYYIAFTDGTTGNRAVRVDSTALTFNATTNTLTNATFSGSLIGTASFASSSISASFASTASYVANSLITASVSSNTITFTKGDGTTFPITVATGSAAPAFPFTGSAGITGSLAVVGPVSASAVYISGSGTQRLIVVGSGSASPIFTVQGSQGELFSVTDSLSGSLFSVNDISGLPILEVFSDNTILMGDYQDPMLLTTKKIAQTTSGSFIVYSIPTSSYDGAFIDYTVKSGSNARAGTIMSTWAGSSIEFTEVDTMDIGSTTAVGLTMILSGSNAVMTGSSSTGAWTIRTIIRAV